MNNGFTLKRGLFSLYRLFRFPTTFTEENGIQSHASLLVKDFFRDWRIYQLSSMKKHLLLAILLLSASLSMAQSITVEFTAEDQNGNYFQLDAVKVTSISQNWNQTLAYPDTTLILSYVDGLGEHSSGVGLLQNRPNPFYGTTETVINLVEDTWAIVQLFDLKGAVLAEYEANLDQGDHVIKVYLAKPQMALLRVSTSRHSYVAKLLNLGNGGENRIEISGSYGKEFEVAEAVGEGPFAVGDVLSYVGIKMQEGDMVLSNNTITQAQYTDDTIKFVFNVETPEEPQLPIVITSDVSEIEITTAVCGGEVISDGGAEVVVRGVCWSMASCPTVNDSCTTDGSGLGAFVSALSNLTAGTTYHVRAYATNSVGTAYGEEKVFTTIFISLPEVITAEVIDITSSTAVCGGEVISDGGAEAVLRGVCWATIPNPTINDSFTTDGNGLGEFESTLSNLVAETMYYVRAYATNSVGTTYGEEKTFITGSYVPVGAINGLFSVSETQQVYFSQGNLQYQASTNMWRFAESQFDFVGTQTPFEGLCEGPHGTVSDSDNANISSTYSGWIDLFGWGTGNNPTNTSTSGYGTFTDWGNNSISNGGNTENQWRTLTGTEWEYLISIRNTSSGVRFAKATINEVRGVIILPDDWNITYYGLGNTNNENAAFTSNIISSTDWTSILEANGAVFLPAAGTRYTNKVSHMGIWGLYWSSTMGSALRFRYDLLEVGWENGYSGLSVRLVSDAE